jgi:hypothetical protein
LERVNKDIGLKLEISNLLPFLNTGFTIDNVNLVGKILEETDLLQIYVKGELIKVVLKCNILTEISSHQ